MKPTVWKMLILIKGCILLLKTCYDERSDFPVEVQDTLSYQHDLCMKKTRAFNVWGLKTSYEKQIQNPLSVKQESTQRIYIGSSQLQDYVQFLATTKFPLTYQSYKHCSLQLLAFSLANQP